MNLNLVIQAHLSRSFSFLEQIEMLYANAFVNIVASLGLKLRVFWNENLKVLKDGFGESDLNAKKTWKVFMYLAFKQNKKAPAIQEG